MILSMTGYGKAVGNVGNKKIAFEIRSLNSKQLDLNVRMPSFFSEKEMPNFSKDFGNNSYSKASVPRYNSRCTKLR